MEYSTHAAVIIMIPRVCKHKEKALLLAIQLSASMLVEKGGFLLRQAVAVAVVVAKAAKGCLLVWRFVGKLRRRAAIAVPTSSFPCCAAALNEY